MTEEYGQWFGHTERIYSASMWEHESEDFRKYLIDKATREVQTRIEELQGVLLIAKVQVRIKDDDVMLLVVGWSPSSATRSTLPSG